MPIENPISPKEQQTAAIRNELDQQLAALGFKETPELQARRSKLAANFAGQPLEPAEPGKPNAFGPALGEYQDAVRGSLPDMLRTDAVVSGLATLQVYLDLGNIPLAQEELAGMIELVENQGDDAGPLYELEDRINAFTQS